MNTGEALKILTNGSKIKQKSWPEGRYLTLKDGEIVDETGKQAAIGGYPPASWQEDVPMKEFYRIVYRSSKRNGWAMSSSLYESMEHFSRTNTGSSYKYCQILDGPFLLPKREL